MAKKRTLHSAEFKAKVALDALSITLRWEQKTLAELSQVYKLQSTQISAWKSALLEGAILVFDKHCSLKEREEYEAREQELYARFRTWSISSIRNLLRNVPIERDTSGIRI